MPPIPDTGGGLSGFLAHYLWRVYRHFPSSGESDWLLLFVCLGMGTYAVFLPYVWKSVKADMSTLEQRQTRQETVPWQHVVPTLWGIFWMFFFVWFFHTPAGRTLLDGREILGRAPLTETQRGFFWRSVIPLSLLGCLAAVVVGITCERSPTADRSTPFPRRTPWCLYVGGGTFVALTSKGKPATEPFFSVGIVSSMLAAEAHWFYWYWSAASTMLMNAFVAAAIVTDGVRMTFVYIQHKRTFG